MRYDLTNRPAATRTPHLFLPSTFQIRQQSSYGVRWSVEGFWAGRKSGRLNISHGFVSGSSASPGAHNFGLHDFLQDEGDRFKGGSVKVRWNGDYLWVDPAARVNLTDHVRVVQVLDTLWSQVNAGNWAVPAGYDGWWQPEK